jgi:hypothetical protein
MRELILTQDDWCELLADHSFNTCTQDLSEVLIYPDDFTPTEMAALARGESVATDLAGEALLVSIEPVALRA